MTKEQIKQIIERYKQLFFTVGTEKPLNSLNDEVGEYLGKRQIEFLEEELNKLKDL